MKTKQRAKYPKTFKELLIQEMTLQTEVAPEVKTEVHPNLPRSTPEAPPKLDPEVPVWVSALIALDFQKGAYSQEAIAKVIGKSSTAVRQAVKSIQQVIPVNALVNEAGITELGKTLILRSQQRGDLTMARWVAQLGDWLGAIPETRQWQALSADDSATLKRTVADAKEQTSAIQLRAKDKLSALKARYSSAVAVSDEMNEADVTLKAQSAYERKIDELAAVFEAEQKAIEDFEAMKRELGA